MNHAHYRRQLSDSIEEVKALAGGGDIPAYAQGGEAPDFIPDTHFVSDSAAQQNIVPNSVQMQAPDFIPEDQFVSDEERFSTPSEMAKTFAEGAGRGASFGLTGALESEESRLRAEENPLTHAAGEVAGLVGSAFIPYYGEANILGKAGAGAVKLAGLAGAETVGGKLAAGAVKGAVENMLYQATSGEVGKLLSGDPSQSLGTAAVDIGLSGLLGAGAGGAFAGVPILWKATAGDKLGKVIADFKGRMNEHLTTPEPVVAVTDELKAYYSGIKSTADEVYGAHGLKAQDVAKALPQEITPVMGEHIQDLYNKVDSKVKKMVSEPNLYPPRLTSKLQMDLEAFAGKVSAPNATTSDLFNAAQDLKQTLQGYSKYDKFVKPVDEAYDFVKASKELAFELRNALEDSKVWGKAAERQKAINKAFTEYKPALEDFEKKFTSEINGERTIDPGKINTYINQLGKPNAELKQEMLKNFIDASEKYRSVLGVTHQNLGLSEMLEPSSLAVVMRTLGKQTTGSKLADQFVKNGLAQAGGKAMGAAVGGGLGGALGLGGFGALIGQHTLGPFFSAVLPTIAKHILKMGPKAEALKSVAEYGLAVEKGERALNRAIKEMFKGGVRVAPDTTLDKRTERLDKALQKLKVDSSPLMSLNANAEHYLPGTGEALGQKAMNAVNYLNSARPGTDPMAPLDSRLKPSQAQIGEYKRALIIAESPLSVLEYMMQGRLTPKDVQTLQTLYPGLYTRMSQKLMDKVIEAKSKGELIPYKTRLNLSMFLGQPLDSTMSQMGILGAQMGQMSQKPPAPPIGAPAKHSTAALSKLPNQYQTIGQGAESRRNPR